MNTITYDELKGLQRTFSLYIWFPEKMFDKIRVAERFDNKGDKMFERLKKIYYKKYFKYETEN